MRSIKKIIAALLPAVILLTCVTPTYATAVNRPIGVYLDGRLVDFGVTNGQQVQALTLYDYAYVPVARIIEILTGSAPAWNDATKTASFVYSNKSVSINTNQSGIYINNVFVPSVTGTPPTIVNDRTLIPLKMLTTALNFGQTYDGATHTVWLTSPPPAPVATPTPIPATPAPAIANVISASADKSTMNAGETATVTVRANGVTSMVKVVDSNNNTLAESRSFRPEGSDNIFTLEIKPTTGNRFLVYAGTSSYTTSYKEINITVNAITIAVNSVTPNNTNPTKGTSIQISIATSTNATRVWLNHSSKGNFRETTTGYTDSGNTRTWKIDYSVDLDGSQTFTAYAADAAGNTANRSFSLTIGSGSPVIHEAYAVTQSISTNTTTNLVVITNTDITDVSYTLSGGSGSLQTYSYNSGYSDSNSRRTWPQNVFYAGYNNETVTITVTARTSSGSTITRTLTVNVGVGGSSSDNVIYNVSRSPSGSPLAQGQSITYYVETGLGTTYLRATIYGSTYTATQTGTSGSRKTWQIYMYAPSSGGQQCSVTIAAQNSNGNEITSVDSFYVN